MEPIQIDIRDLRTNLTLYINKYCGRRIYVSKYNKVIGEFKFYSDSEKKQARVKIAKEIILNSGADLNI